MEFQAKWIRAQKMKKGVCPVFKKIWVIDKAVKHADLYLTALGVQEALLNGVRIIYCVLAPGWTGDNKRLQYQHFDST